jgi:hypothetical protein
MILGGHLKPDLYFNIPKYIKMYGLQAAVDVANFEAAQVLAVKALVEKEKIECDFTLTRACDAVLHEGLASDTEKAFRELQSTGAADLRDVHFTSGKDAERVRILVPTYILHYDAPHGT